MWLRISVDLVVEAKQAEMGAKQPGGDSSGSSETAAGGAANEGGSGSRESKSFQKGKWGVRACMYVCIFVSTFLWLFICLSIFLPPIHLPYIPAIYTPIHTHMHACVYRSISGETPKHPEKGESLGSDAMSTRKV
jgi:hypothetical protein